MGGGERGVRADGDARDAAPTLQKALLEADDLVWTEALDGLVALGGSQAEQALREARERLVSQGGGGIKRQWLDEAIEQIGASKRERSGCAGRSAPSLAGFPEGLW